MDKDGTDSLDFPELQMMMCLKSDIDKCGRRNKGGCDEVLLPLNSTLFNTSSIFLQDDNEFINRQELACVMGMGNLGIDVKK